MTKKEKQIQWLKEQGYVPNSCNRVPVIADNGYSYGCYYTAQFPVFDKLTISGVINNGKLIPIPDFEDDEEKPVDKALSRYVDSLYVVADELETKAWLETNERLKALEKKAFSMGSS